MLTEPALFDQDDADGRVRLLVPRPEGDLLEAARDAIDLCPNQALTLVPD